VSEAKQPLNLVVLYTPGDSSTQWAAHELERDPSPYLPQHHWAKMAVQAATLQSQLLEFARIMPDVIVNLCDGSFGEDRPGWDVIVGLERLGIPYTGVGPRTYDVSREAQKMAAHSAGFLIPDFQHVRDATELDLERPWRFPLLVKHPGWHNSIGLTRASRVEDVASLQRQVELMTALYGGALVEEFIEGAEYTVLVVEPMEEGEPPQALTPIEFTFPPGESFKHFDLKWVDYERTSASPVRDPDLAARLYTLSSSTFLALGMDGYARVDVRADRSGNLYFLEINSNPSVFYAKGSYGSADLILAADPLGHSGFVERIVQAGLRRAARCKRSWKVGYDRARGFGSYAARNFGVGEQVLSDERMPAVLVTHRFVEERWRGILKEWYAAYAYPVSENVSAVWSENPEEWRPINHSCDPNTWLDGLDLVARKPIRAGEELTMDYATFCGPRMAEFPCTCGAPECRGIICGADCYSPELEIRYGNHVSDYVRYERSRPVVSEDVPWALLGRRPEPRRGTPDAPDERPALPAGTVQGDSRTLGLGTEAELPLKRSTTSVA
jgi:D-alanine-D-alanine ligase-like ATP-grasp enzyme